MTEDFAGIGQWLTAGCKRSFATLIAFAELDAHNSSGTVPAGHICIAYLPRQRFEPIMFSRYSQIRIDSRNKHFGSSPRSSEGNGGNKEGSA